MFRTWTFRYAVLGILIGLIFPIVDTLSTLAEQNLPLTLDSIVYLQFGEGREIHRWIIDLIPLILAGALAPAGRQRDLREREVRQLKLNTELRAILNRSAGLDMLLNELALKWAELIDAGACSFASWDRERDLPIPLHPRGPFDLLAASTSVLPDKTPLVKWVIDHNKTQILGGDRAVLALPLAVNNRAFGAAIFVHTHPERSFGEEDVWVVSGFAGQVALTIDHIRTGAEIRRRARDMEAISQVARSLAAGWKINRILKTVAGSTQVRFGMDYVGILTIDETNREFVMRVQSGPLAQDTALTHRQSVAEGLLARVYETGQMVLTRDVREEPSYVGVTGSDTRSELIIPLRSSDRVIGAIGFASRHVDAFSQDDIVALQMLADQVSVAVENARLYEDAQRERQRLSAVLASTGDTVIVTDALDHVQFFNRAAERLFGISAEQAIGKRLDESVRLPALVEAYHNETEASIFELALSNTTTLIGNLTTVSDKTLGVVGRVLTLHDISDLKRLDMLKSQMIRMASHDLRNPLNLSFGYLDLLHEELAGRIQTAGPLLEGLNSGLQRMQRLIEDLLNVERIESASERIRERVDLKSVARQAAGEMQALADGKHHTLSVHTETAPAIVHADPVQIRQVVVNLISNAIKYTPDGGQIQTRVRCVDGKVILEVEDNGFGIAKEAQTRLFQRFYRVKTEETQDIEGTGLGLSLVKAIIEQHDGAIEVDSEVGRGSVFRIRLPAPAEEAA